MDIHEAKSKAARYCAYQERARSEVEEKLRSYGIGYKEIKTILAELTQEGFIDETRFAKIYAIGKFRSNKWGKSKIRQYLILKQVNKAIIEQGLDAIPEDEYLKMIKNLVILKHESMDEPDAFIAKNRIATYLIQKGFESEVVWDILNE